MKTVEIGNKPSKYRMECIQNRDAIEATVSQKCGSEPLGFAKSCEIRGSDANPAAESETLFSFPASGDGAVPVLLFNGFQFTLERAAELLGAPAREERGGRHELAVLVTTDRAGYERRKP